MDNYFERIDFTRIEIILLFGVIALLFTRAVVDYSYGWKNFWSKFAGAE